MLRKLMTEIMAHACREGGQSPVPDGKSTSILGPFPVSMSRGWFYVALLCDESPLQPTIKIFGDLTEDEKNIQTV